MEVSWSLPLCCVSSVSNERTFFSCRILLRDEVPPPKKDIF